MTCEECGEDKRPIVFRVGRVCLSCRWLRDADRQAAPLPTRPDAPPEARMRLEHMGTGHQAGRITTIGIDRRRP